MAEQQGQTRIFSMAAAAEAFGAGMLKEDHCVRWIVSSLHPDNPCCPHCSVPVSVGAQTRFYQLEQIRCHACGKKFTAATGTLLCGSKLDARQIYLLAVLLFLEVPPARIAGVLRCHVDTVHNWSSHFSSNLQGATGV